MWHSNVRLQHESGALAADAAGLALACAYSSSDEYEAAVIAERCAAGAYGGNHKQILFAVIALVTLVLAVALS